MAERKDKKSYYAVIPAPVRYDRRLPPRAVLLYGEISALCHEKGYCWSTNSYFAELYEVRNETVSRWIEKLEKYGYIRSVIDHEGGNKRELYLLTEKSIPIDKKVNRVLTKTSIPIDEKVNHNITVNSESEYYNEYKGDSLKDLSPSRSRKSSLLRVLEALKIKPPQKSKGQGKHNLKRSIAQANSDLTTIGDIFDQVETRVRSGFVGIEIFELIAQTAEEKAKSKSARNKVAVFVADMKKEPFCYKPLGKGLKGTIQRLMAGFQKMLPENKL